MAQLTRDQVVEDVALSGARLIHNIIDRTRPQDTVNDVLHKTAQQALRYYPVKSRLAEAHPVITEEEVYKYLLDMVEFKETRRGRR